MRKVKDMKQAQYGSIDKMKSSQDHKPRDNHDSRPDQMESLYQRQKEFDYNKPPLKNLNVSEKETTDTRERKALANDYNMLLSKYNKLLVETSTLRKKFASVEQNNKVLGQHTTKLERDLFNLTRIVDTMLKADEKNVKKRK